MTPVLQTAVTGLIWALSTSLVIFVSTFCVTWVMRIADDRKAIEVERRLEEIESRNQNGPCKCRGEEAACEGEALTA